MKNGFAFGFQEITKSKSGSSGSSVGLYKEQENKVEIIRKVSNIKVKSLQLGSSKDTYHLGQGK